MENRAGKFIINLSGEAQYKSFSPNPLPPVLEMDDEMVSYTVKANKTLSLLESLTGLIPHMPLFVSMYVRKEALLSSQIEGTQTTLEDVLNPNLDKNTNRDVSDVINYIKATEYALERLKTLPLCNRLLRELHEVLMQNVRGQEKSPGEFRRSQNWIGGQGSTLKNARYIPPNVEDMQKCMSDLEKYIHAEDTIDPLIQAALIHYQFETIHPFLDGNGRVGRLLITLFLIEKKVLSSPALYISYFLKKNRIEYYDRMMEVRKKGTFEQWIKFFLSAVINSAEDAVLTIKDLHILHNENVEKLQKERSAKNLILVLDYLERQPIIDISKTAQRLELSYNTTAKAVQTMQRLNILVANDNKNRNKTFSYKQYLDILKKGTD